MAGSASGLFSRCCGCLWEHGGVYAPVRAGHSKCISLGVAPSICKAELDKGIARRKKEELPGAVAVFALAPIAIVWLIIWTMRRIRRRFQPAS